MVKKSKNYFSFYGILIATVSSKIHSQLNKIACLILINQPKILKSLHEKQLKPIKLYSTNQIKSQGNLK